MVGGGCCTNSCASDDVGIGALLLKRDLVFSNVAFLGNIADVMLTFFPENEPGPFLWHQSIDVDSGSRSSWH